VAAEKVVDLDAGLEAAEELQPLLAELLSRPACRLKQPLALLLVLDLLMAKVEGEQEFLSVPQHTWAPQLTKELNALDGLGPALGDVAERDDQVRLFSREVHERGAEGNGVSVHVGEERHSHGRELMAQVREGVDGS
jgi:hypothetical protein